MDKNDIDSLLNGYKLWNNFKQNSGEETVGQLKIIIKNTIPLLKQIVRTFPTYTNHDNEHSFKILEIMAMLLGDKIDKLSPAESAVLLLSAFWHDLGMICNDKSKIKNEPWFDDYVKNNNNINADSLDESIISDYIRTNHHNRLEKYIFDRDDVLPNGNKSLQINGYDIIDIAYKVSVSHNHDTKKLADLRELSSKDGKDDFVFCALLLRLADIMDFDNDRTPESVYRFLGLKNPKSNSEEISKKEWQKHLGSLGFDYKNNILYFKATPKEPDIEHAIRGFIKVIENELEKCKDVFNDYCHKWRDSFKLPHEIDISGIKSDSLYEYDDYVFTFDNKQTLDLLTGNNIYSDKTIFIRELLQNSIDALLYREALEKQKGNQSFKSKPINITDWYDRHGNYWIRFDDHGIGMDKYILLNYFTKIGKSFYESKDFNRETGFTAISRFGIGILSCFMVADKIEVSTRKEGCEAIRFSIKSLHSYFVTRLESKHKRVEPFPSANDDVKEKYRKEVGTSIAIQIDFNKINRWFEIKEELERHIFYSPVEIRYKDEKVGTTLEELDKNPWIDEETIVELTAEDNATIKEFFELTDIEETFKIKVTPVNLSEYSPTKKIKAQMVMVQLCSCIDLRNNDYEIRVELTSTIDKNLQLFLRKNYFKDSKAINLSSYEKLAIFSQLSSSKVGHNGIFVAEDFSDSYHEKILNFTKDGLSLAHIYLSDEYRPSMGLSRSSEVSFDYKTLTTANLALARFITENNIADKTYDCSLLRNRFFNNFSYQEIVNDPLLDEWKKQKIFDSHNGIISFEDIIDELTKKSIITEHLGISFSYPSIDHLNVDYIYKKHTRNMYVEILTSLFLEGNINQYAFCTVYSESKNKHENIEYFPIGFFHKYKKNTYIEHFLQAIQHERLLKYAVNIEHPFSVWLLNNAKTLNEKYKGIFEDIKNNFMLSTGHTIDHTRLISVLRLLKKINSNIINDEIIESVK